MDQQNLELRHSSGSRLSSMEGRDHNDAFLDEPQTSRTQSQLIHTEICRPLNIGTHGAEEDLSLDDSQSFLPDTPDPSLPLMLRLLFGLNGLSLSLLTLPIMYILNTRVEVPLPYLPAYGAIAFLPYSLKPMYAYLCGLWAKRFKKAAPQFDNTDIESNRSQHNNNDSHCPHRYLELFRWLLVSNSVCTLLFASIPKDGVLAVFVVAFLRGVTDSWAEFCLGLTLIDHARANYSSRGLYESAVSVLQTQSATAGNLGAWLASLVTCLVLVGRRFASQNDGDEAEQHPQLTGGLTNALVIVTALIQLTGAISVYFWEKRQLLCRSSTGIYNEIPTEAQHGSDGSTRPESLHSDVGPTENDSLRDEEASHPSYSSLEDSSDDGSDEDNTIISTQDTSTLVNNPSRSPRKIANWAIVVLLQCVLVTIALKGPIIEISSHLVWVVLVVSFLVGICLSAITLCCKFGNKTSGGGSDMTTFRVGLFLVLKNAVPSDSAILASFFYALFGTNQPLLLQFLSFLGMGVSTLSSWSYSRLFSHRFGSGRSLVGLLAGTCGLASLASLLHIAVFRVYQASETEEFNDEFVPSRSLLLIAVVSKFITTFFDERAFLPELVLATTSVKVPTTVASTSTTNTMDRSQTETPGLSTLLTSTFNNYDSADDDDQQKRIAMEYGTLVSCIDFGDQLGSLIAAPLVAVWQISRDNGFLHLDRLIVFCSVSNVLITIGLLPLLWNIGPKTNPRPIELNGL